MKQLVLVSVGMLLASPLIAADGKAIFERSCAACHSINPPPKAAPPIASLATRFHQKYQTKEKGVKQLAAYLKAPDKKNAIDQQAIDRFGIMPAQALSDEELKTVSEWVWEQATSAMGRRKCMQRQLN